MVSFDWPCVEGTKAASSALLDQRWSDRLGRRFDRLDRSVIFGASTCGFVNQGASLHVGRAGQVIHDAVLTDISLERCAALSR